MHESVHTENSEIRNDNLHAGTFNKTIPYLTTGCARMFFSGSGLNLGISCFGKSRGLYRGTSFSSVSPFLLCSDFFPPQVPPPGLRAGQLQNVGDGTQPGSGPPGLASSQERPRGWYPGNATASPLTPLGTQLSTLPPPSAACQ